MNLSQVSSSYRISDSTQQYQLLLHSLTHIHTKDNYDRHVLLFEKWCQDYRLGFFIKDLEYVILLFRVLRERLLAEPILFRPVTLNLLQICAKPILESRANERFKPQSIENIRTYFKEITLFWKQSDSKLGSEICRAFRCIINGGNDPSLLSDGTELNFDKNSMMQVTDNIFIHQLLRDSGALDSIVEKFLESLGTYRRSAELFLKASQDEEGPSSPQSHSQASLSSMSLSEHDHAGHNQSNADTVKQSVVAAQEFTNLMLDLSLELSQDPHSAAHMCSLKVCDGAVEMLYCQVNRKYGSGAMDRTAALIELMWTCLEGFLSIEKAKYKLPQLGQNKYHPGSSDPSSRVVMDFERAVRVLQDVLRIALTEGYRLADKEYRNEILIVLILMAEFRQLAFPCFVESGLINTLVSYACVAEAGPAAWSFFSSPLAKLSNFASAFDIDLQFKRLLWTLISDVLNSDDGDALLCVASSPLISSLLMYLEKSTIEGGVKGVSVNITGDPSPSSPGPSEGHEHFEHTESSFSLGAQSVDLNQTSNTLRAQSESLARDNSLRSSEPLLQTKRSNVFTGQAFLDLLSLSQLREFQVMAITFLCKNAIKVLGEFVRIQGPKRILEITSHYSHSNLPEHKTVVKNALILINKCVLASNVMKGIMEEEVGIKIFLSLFERSDDDPTRAQCANLISLLCSGGNLNCQRQVRHLGGIELMLKAISTYEHFKRPVVGLKAGINLSPNKEKEMEDPTEDNTGDVSVLIVSVLGSISSAVVGNRLSESSLAKSEGIDTILDLLETSPHVLRVQVLRLLSDLLENRQMLSFVNAWRSGKTMRSAAQLIAHCWLDEEVRLDSVRENGIVSNLMNPLGNHVWPAAPSSAQLWGDTLSSNSIPEARSNAVSRLSNAIKENRLAQTRTLSVQVMDKVLSRDIRCIAANIMHLMSLFYLDGDEGVFEHDGLPLPLKTPSSPPREDPPNTSPSVPPTHFSSAEFSKPLALATSNSLPAYSLGNDFGLTPSDKQVITLAKYYHLLREGEWWTEVLSDLDSEHILPIELDDSMIQKRLDRVFRAKISAQSEQMELRREESEILKSNEQKHIDQILTKKIQQIKAEWLKRNRKNKK